MATSEVALRVLTNHGLLTAIAAFSSGVSYSVYQVKQALVCASNAHNPKDPVSPQDVALWQNAICAGDRKTLEALQLLSTMTKLGERLRETLRGIVGFAFTHTKDRELLTFIDDDDLFPDEDHYKLTPQDESVLGSQGDLELIEWMLSRDYALSTALSSGAVDGGQLQLLQYLHEHADLPFDCKGVLMKLAAAKGHLDIVTFLHENRQRCNHYHDSHEPSAMDEAATNGHLEVVKYLHEHELEPGSHRAMDGAAGSGHLAVVQYLHVNRHEGCTTQAMDDAIKHKHYAVVAFLHAKRTEGCSCKAMENAIEADDLELLKRLCEYQAQGSLEIAIQFAAKRGQVKFVKMLFETLSTQSAPSYLPREDLVNHAAMHGNLELLKFFHAHEHFRFSSKAMHNAAISDHLHVVKFLHEHRAEGCKVDTLLECDRRELTRIVEFLCARRPMDKPERAIVRAKKEGRMLLTAKLEHMKSAAGKTYLYR